MDAARFRAWPHLRNLEHENGAMGDAPSALLSNSNVRTAMLDDGHTQVWYQQKSKRDGSVAKLVRSPS